MEFSFFSKGLLLGFSIAAPVGPIGLLCIARTLEKGRIAGLVTGLGAATADSIYGFVAAFGLSVLTSWLTSISIWIKLIGGIFLLYLGFKTSLSKVTNKAEIKDTHLLSHYLSTVLLTLTNPSTILSFMAIFAGFGIASRPVHWSTSSLLVLGVFCGSALWWFMLSALTNWMRLKITEKHLLWINRGSGLLIGSFGVWSIFSSLS